MAGSEPDRYELDLHAAGGQADTDAGTELVADIESRLRDSFPELPHSPEVFRTIETVVQEKAYLFAGPIPPPHLLAEYEQICPGSAARLLEQSEREQLWRIERTREELLQSRYIIEADATMGREQQHLENKGLNLGFLAFLVVAGIGVFALHLGQIAVALACFTTFALGVVGLFVTRKRGGPA